jgi:hypothetical protein
MDIFTLAAIEPGSLENATMGMGSWWRTIGGLAVVFGLLFLCLKFVTRYGKKSGATQARVLAVWHLGPKREIQVLRLGEDVSYVYRHESAMVLLRQGTWEEYRREHGEATSGLAAGPTLPPALARWLGSLQERLPRPQA